MKLIKGDCLVEMGEVKSVTRMLSEIVEMENGQQYIRNASDDWAIYYSNSFEGLFLPDRKTLEDSYQRFKVIVKLSMIP